MAYVAVHGEEREINDALEKSYELPNRAIMTINRERFKCTEPLFQPRLFGERGPGVSELICKTISQIEDIPRTPFYQNIMICGGNSMLPGFTERVTKELKEMQALQAQIVSPSQFGKYASWLGGSIFSTIMPADYWLNRKEYEETGTSIQYKCM